MGYGYMPVQQTYMMYDQFGYPVSVPIGADLPGSP